MNTVRHRLSFRRITQRAKHCELATQELTHFPCFLLPSFVPKHVFWYLPLSPDGSTAACLDVVQQRLIHALLQGTGDSDVVLTGQGEGAGGGGGRGEQRPGIRSGGIQDWPFRLAVFPLLLPVTRLMKLPTPTPT